MIRFDDIMTQVEQKRPKRHHPPGDKWDVFCNKLESKRNINLRTGEQTLFDTKNSEKTTSKSGSVFNNLQKTSQMSLARKSVRVNENDFFTNISMENSQNINTYARASDKRDTFQPGKCDQCSASGFWDYKGPGKWCFHRAFFLGKPGQPVHCDSAKHSCPLIQEIHNK